MDRFYVVGGRQRPEARHLDEWRRFECAVIAELDPESGGLRTCVEYATPPDAAPPEGASPVFKAGTLDGDVLWVPTQTEVLAYRVPEFALLQRISLPAFNDVHHVRPAGDGRLWVASTGLDAVLEVSREGELLRAFDACGEEPWTRFARDVDWRRVPTTKPHRAHPNFVFTLDGEVWTTRFEQRDAVCVSRWGERIAIDQERPHDGVGSEGSLWFTTVDGRVVQVDAALRRVVRSVALAELGPRPGPLGWCRGIEPLGDERVVVGFSRIRATRFAANLRWLGERLRGGSPPTHVALYDLRRGALVWEHAVQAAGIDAVFSVHRAPGP